MPKRRYTAHLADGTTLEADDVTHSIRHRSYTLEVNKPATHKDPAKRLKYTVPEVNLKYSEEALDVD